MAAGSPRSHSAGLVQFGGTQQFGELCRVELELVAVIHHEREPQEQADPIIAQDLAAEIDDDEQHAVICVAGLGSREDLRPSNDGLDLARESLTPGHRECGGTAVGVTGRRSNAWRSSCCSLGKWKRVRCEQCLDRRVIVGVLVRTSLPVLDNARRSHQMSRGWTDYLVSPNPAQTDMQQPAKLGLHRRVRLR